MEDSILVSIIIRTCNRPDVLKQALDSIRNQTYKNIEVVVVEDGMNTSESMIRCDYSDLFIKYKANNKRLGRTVTGNIGLSLATGQYFNFLDDDDILYSNHIEVLLNNLKGKKQKAAYGIAEESQITLLPKQSYSFKEKRRVIRYKQPYNRLLLYSFNYLPIQSVLFHRDFYDLCGGFDETFDMLEDWDLWVRYSTIGEFLFVPVITSRYHVPYKRKIKKNRGKNLDKALKKTYEKFATYNLKSSVGDLQREMDYVLNIYNQKTVIYYMKQLWNYFVYGDR